jgi:large subunit ribosomal protein L10
MVSAKKKELVQNLTAQVRDYPIIGLADLENLPAQQLQRMRATLFKKGVIICMTRKKLINMALKSSEKKNVDALIEKVRGVPALILSKDNPFALNSLLEKNKSEAPARPGQILPKEVMVKAGPTNFAPGPIISELAAVGIKTKVENGKLAVIKDTVIGKEGDVVSPKLSETMKRLDIKPMEIGLNLVAVLEDGLVFTSKQLHIDEAEFSANLTQAAQWAINLSVEAAYLTKDTAEFILQKAFREAKAISVEQGIITEETRDEILAKAESQALAVKDAGQIDAQVEAKPCLEPSSPKPEVKRQEIKPEVQPEARPEGKKYNKEQTPHPMAEEKTETQAPASAPAPESAPKAKVHPKQGTVTMEEAGNLLEKLRKEGTLRNKN